MGAFHASPLPAHRTPEIAARPALVMTVSASPPPAKPKGRAVEPVDVSRAEAVARSSRRLAILIGLDFLVPSGLVVAAYLPPGWDVGTAIVLVTTLLVLLIPIALAGYRLASELGLFLPVLWAFPVLVPLINLLPALVLELLVRRWCRRHGLAAGLFGPTREALADLRGRELTEPFE